MGLRASGVGALDPTGRGKTGLCRPREELPYSSTGLLVEQSSVYINIRVRLVLTFMWNREDSALVRMPARTPLPTWLGRPRRGAGVCRGWGPARLAEAWSYPSPVP